LQDALEQHRQLGCRLVAVFFGKLDHRVLHDVQRGFVLAYGVDGLLEGPAFDVFEEVG
jgi:hypothetical protein